MDRIDLSGKDIKIVKSYSFSSEFFLWVPIKCSFLFPFQSLSRVDIKFHPSWFLPRVRFFEILFVFVCHLVVLLAYPFAAIAKQFFLMSRPVQNELPVSPLGIFSQVRSGSKSNSLVEGIYIFVWNRDWNISYKYLRTYIINIKFVYPWYFSQK